MDTLNQGWGRSTLNVRLEYVPPHYYSICNVCRSFRFHHSRARFHRSIGYRRGLRYIVLRTSRRCLRRLSGKVLVAGGTSFHHFPVVVRGWCTVYCSVPCELLHADILRNILYSGVWCRYTMVTSKRYENQNKENNHE